MRKKDKFIEKSKFFFSLGNPLAFTSAYEQILLSQSQSTVTKQDNRQPMNLV